MIPYKIYVIELELRINFTYIISVEPVSLNIRVQKIKKICPMGVITYEPKV